MKLKNRLGWIQDDVDPEGRSWEEFYRNRWQHDRVVRSTHGVNCTGSCTWDIYVKNGIVTWEMQGPRLPDARAGAATLRAAWVPARDLLLLVPLQSVARQVPLHPGGADRPVA